MTVLDYDDSLTRGDSTAAAMPRLWWAAVIWCTVTAAQMATRFVGEFHYEISALLSPSHQQWPAVTTFAATAALALILLGMLLRQRLIQPRSRLEWSVSWPLSLLALLVIAIDLRPVLMDVWELGSRFALDPWDALMHLCVRSSDFLVENLVPLVLLLAWLRCGKLTMTILAWTGVAWLAAEALSWGPTVILSFDPAQTRRITTGHLVARCAYPAAAAAGALILTLLVVRTRSASPLRAWSIRITAATMVVAIPLLFMAYGMTATRGAGWWFAAYTVSDWLLYAFNLLLLAGGALAALLPTVTWPRACG